MDKQGNKKYAVPEYDEVGKCPKCGSKLKPRGYSGTECSRSNCDYWFCY